MCFIEEADSKVVKKLPGGQALTRCLHDPTPSGTKWLDVSYINPCWTPDLIGSMTDGMLGSQVSDQDLKYLIRISMADLWSSSI